jgi:hypothetical protein
MFTPVILFLFIHCSVIRLIAAQSFMSVCNSQLINLFTTQSVTYSSGSDLLTLGHSVASVTKPFTHQSMQNAVIKSEEQQNGDAVLN